jgi:hypothetical protein
MGMMMLATLIVILAVAFMAVRLVSRELPSGSVSDQERRLAEQAEEIELLKDELRQLKDQADFTERLLTERSEEPDGGGDAETRS